jgi:hypothetical protein
MNQSCEPQKLDWPHCPSFGTLLKPERGWQRET